MALLTRALSFTPITSSQVMRPTITMPGRLIAMWWPKTMGSSAMRSG